MFVQTRKAVQNGKTSPPPLKKRKTGVSSSLVLSQMTGASSVGQVTAMEKKPLHIDEHMSQGRNRERHKTNIPARLSDIHPNLIPLPSPPVVSVETKVVAQSSVPAEPTDQVPLSKPAVCKIANLTRDEQFQQVKQILMDKEKIRALDDVIDLSDQPRKAFQLVSWRRFHHNFHSGKVLIRYLTLNRHLIISVIKPIDKVATKNTWSIQNLKNDPRAPDTIKELLDPYPSFTSSEQKSRYSLLRFDGVTWKWIGCSNLEPVTVLPSTSRAPPPLQPEVTTTKSFTASSSSNQKKKPKDPVPQSMPKKPPLSEQNRTKQSTSLVVVKKPPSPAVLEATTAEQPTRVVANPTRPRVKLLRQTNRSGRPKERKKSMIMTQQSSTFSSCEGKKQSGFVSNGSKRFNVCAASPSLQPYDLFNAGIMERLHLLSSSRVNQNGPVFPLSNGEVTLTSKIIGKRFDKDGCLTFLLRWAPPDFLPDQWVTENKVVGSKRVPVHSFKRL